MENFEQRLLQISKSITYENDEDGYYEYIANKDHSDVLNNLHLLYDKKIFKDIMMKDISLAGSVYLREYTSFWFKQDINLLYEILEFAIDNEKKIDFDFTESYSINTINELKSFLKYTNLMKNKKFQFSLSDIQSCLKINKDYIRSISDNDFYSFFKNYVIDTSYKIDYNLDNVFYFLKLFPIFNNSNGNSIETIKTKIYVGEIDEKHEKVIKLLVEYKNSSITVLRNNSLKFRWGIIKDFFRKENEYYVSYFNFIITNLLNQEDNKWDIQFNELINEIDLFKKDIYKDEYLESIRKEIFIYSNSLISQIKKSFKNDLEFLDGYSFSSNEEWFNNILWCIVLHKKNGLNDIAYICNEYYQLNMLDCIPKPHAGEFKKNINENIECYLNQILFNSKYQHTYSEKKFKSLDIINRICSIYNFQKDHSFLFDCQKEEKYLSFFKNHLEKLDIDNLLKKIEIYPEIYYILDDNIQTNKKVTKYIKKNNLFIRINYKLINKEYTHKVFLVLFFIIVYLLFK